MEEDLLPKDFKEFLKLLNEAKAQYLLIGGYAVGYHGYPRSTADMDIWIAISPDHADKVLLVFKQFGMNDPSTIKDPTFFGKVGVHPDFHTLYWPNGADFSPEFLYEHIHILSHG